MDDMMTGRIGITGHRSFIARELTTRLVRTMGRSVDFLNKGYLGVMDMSGLDCVYLILGRAKPTPEESEGERQQLADFLGNPRKPRRAVYISSMSMTESKLWCEARIREYGVWRAGSLPIPITVLRPGAVFGPDQDPESRMLIPSMVRGGPDFSPDWPMLLTRFISVGDLAAHLTSFADPGWWDVNRSGEPDSMCDIPGTFTLTPHQVGELYRAFKGLERANAWREER